MILDVVNAMFEAGGAYFTWRNAYQLYVDKKISGIYKPSWFFFTSWGLWNIIYYSGLQQWFSFYAGIALVSGNVMWCILSIIYRNRK